MSGQPRRKNRSLSSTANRLPSLLVLALATLAAGGCGGKPETGTAPDKRLTVLGALFNQYSTLHRGQLPPAEADFLAYAGKEGKWLLDKAGIADPKELLVSARDGQPLVVLYGPNAAPSNESRAIAAEAAGVDGVRLAVTTTGSIERLGGAEFEARFGAAAKK